MIFDTHAHFDDEAYDNDRDELLSSLYEHGIEKVVNIGASMKTSEQTIKLIDKYKQLYGAVGVHPSETGVLTAADMARLKELAEHPKVVAIGEIGLDYYWQEPEHDIQKHWFEEQLKLAREIDLPIVVHSRDAAKDTYDMVESYKDLTGIIHCFSYGVEMAEGYLKLGFYLGIGGVITFKNARKLKEVVQHTPLERIVLETDCPYLAPEPYRGKRNSSLYLPYIIKEIAVIKGATEDEVKQITFDNAVEVYRLKNHVNT